MPEAIEDYYARVVAAADDEGRLAIAVDGIASWEVFPFELEGLRLQPIGPRIPDSVRDANARAVIQDLVRTYGGHAVGHAV